MLDCYLHGMPICQCPTECDGCQRELDPSVAAHHLQTCKRRSSKLPTAHDNLSARMDFMLKVKELSKLGLVQHGFMFKTLGDIHIPGIRDRGSEQYEGLMADVTLVHPYDSEASEEDYLERYRVPVSSLPLSAAPGGPPGNAGSLSAAALSPSAAACLRGFALGLAAACLRGFALGLAVPRLGASSAVNPILSLAISTDGTLHPDTLRFIWYLADIIAQRSMPLEDAAFGRHFVPDDGPAAEVLARKRAATYHPYQRLTMQLTLEALLSGARRMTPLRAQALLEPEDSSSSDFVESPEEESSPEGDIHIPGIRDRGSEQYEGLMADVTLVHPYIGSSADLTKWGEVNLDALHVAASEKIRKHRSAYAMTTPPRAFIPLAISTDGTLSHYAADAGGALVWCEAHDALAE
ncbi:hypothetical protein GUITHDRAFT_117288 [Guillardia theta CCMP2712]|uniref:Uncharacterized protein n=1 Tax=Guillardia theta (strain CCMP2712) TaxID=905079 RepID=L1IJT1_GUITC|nr:hypothetical protein GUITHDRAFT_117288 [Guillardia theta CCMP2712]EKX36508.1 hypothetical protein GUITHDRAFT_117288 [Guillardia theta CCMP2712]|eukprot:XP_005823488.1 hypothetical protein GUITHDRAFT_117288 [Guillardia theta CCMP2712]